jgi:hypothetical protein
VAHFAITAHMEQTTGLPAQLLYALLRQNVPSDAAIRSLAKSSAGVPLADNANALLDAIYTVSPTVLETAVNNAIAQNLLPASYAQSAKADLAKLQTLGATARLNSTHGMGKTSIASVLTALAIEPDHQTTFINLFTNVTGSAQHRFWLDLYKNRTFPVAQIASMEFGGSVGRLTRGYQPLISALVAQRTAGTSTNARDLARHSAADCVAILQQPTGRNKQPTPMGPTRRRRSARNRPSAPSARRPLPHPQPPTAVVIASGAAGYFVGDAVEQAMTQATGSRVAGVSAGVGAAAVSGALTELRSARLSPGLGTAVGAGIGVAVGAIAGFIGGYW